MPARVAPSGKPAAGASSPSLHPVFLLAQQLWVQVPPRDLLALKHCHLGFLLSRRASGLFFKAQHKHLEERDQGWGNKRW